MHALLINKVLHHISTCFSVSCAKHLNTYVRIAVQLPKNKSHGFFYRDVETYVRLCWLQTLSFCCILLPSTSKILLCTVFFHRDKMLHLVGVCIKFVFSSDAWTRR